MAVLYQMQGRLREVQAAQPVVWIEQPNQTLTVDPGTLRNLNSKLNLSDDD